MSDQSNKETKRYGSLEEIKREFFPRLHEEEVAAKAARRPPSEVDLEQKGQQ